MGTKARIFRAPKGVDRPYFSMRRETAQDQTLTWEARGMLSFFLSLQDGFEITIDDLMQQCGRDKAYRIIKELRKAHYIERDRIRKEDGTFTWGDYQVYERPHTEKPDTVEPLPENTEMVSGEPLPEKPDTENTESNTHNTFNHKDQNTGPPQSPPPQNGADTSDDVQRVDDPVTIWKDRGFEVGGSYFWWYPDGNKYVPGKLVKVTRHYAFFESVTKTGEIVERKVGPKRCSIDGQTEGWTKVSELEPVQYEIAVGSYRMTDDQCVSGQRMEEINMHRSDLREQFKNGKAVTAQELRAAYGHHAAQKLTPPKVRGKPGDMVNTYRKANAPQPIASTGNVYDDADPNCAICKGNGVVRENGRIVPCDCRVKKPKVSGRD